MHYFKSQYSQDCQEVKILSEGLYQVSCRYLVSGSGSLAVKINNEVLAGACGSGANSCTTVSVCDIAPLKENDVLTVSFGSRNLISGKKSTSYLSIMKLV
jgi:hypothetical protein